MEKQGAYSDLGVFWVAIIGTWGRMGAPFGGAGWLPQHPATCGRIGGLSGRIWGSRNIPQHPATSRNILAKIGFSGAFGVLFLAGWLAGWLAGRTAPAQLPHSSRTAPAQLPRKESWNFCQKKALWGEPQNENLSKTSRSPTQLGKLAPDLRMAEQPPKSEPRIDWRAASAPQERAGSSRPSCPPRRPCGYLGVLISGLGQGRGGRKYEGIPSLFC